MPTQSITSKSNLHRKQVKILNIKVDSTDREELLTNIGQKVAMGEQIYIVTPNPEIALQAQNDELLAEIINNADFSVPDGTGFKLAHWNLNIIHGRKLANDLLSMANIKNSTVFLLGGTPKGIKRAISSTEEKYPNLKVYGEYGPKLDSQANPDTDLDSKVNNDIVDSINKIQPDYLFVGFGAPKQEKWIWKNKDKLKAKCLITVGGTIDYWAGEAKLPPAWMEALELEWLWRLIVDPRKRIKRIFKSIIVFPLKLILHF